MRGFLDRDYLLTKERLIFCVIGYEHPPGRALAYLKYLPHPEGRWRGRLGSFKRTLHHYSAGEVAKGAGWLEEHYPHYLYQAEAYNITIPAVPSPHIQHHFKTEEGLRHLEEKGRPDPLEALTLELVDYLGREAGISPHQFGLTGSLLLGIHSPRFSDIDLTIHGRRAALQVREAMRQQLKAGQGPVRPLAGRLLAEWCAAHSRDYPLTVEEAHRLYQLRWNYATFRGRLFSIHPIRLPEEVSTKYGEHHYTPIGLTLARGVIRDAYESLFLPHTYQVKISEVVSGPPETVEATQVRCYEGLYGDILQDGDEFLVYGKLERVKGRQGEFLAITVGVGEAGGRDFLKPV